MGTDPPCLFTVHSTRPQFGHLWDAVFPNFSAPCHHSVPHDRHRWECCPAWEAIEVFFGSRSMRD